MLNETHTLKARLSKQMTAVDITEKSCWSIFYLRSLGNFGAGQANDERIFGKESKLKRESPEKTHVHSVGPPQKLRGISRDRTEDTKRQKSKLYNW